MKFPRILAAAAAAMTLGACSTGNAELDDALNTGVEVLNVGLTLGTAVITGYNAGRSGSFYVPSTSHVNRGNYSPVRSTANSSRCLQLQNLVAQCRHRQARMATAGTYGAGTTGQAGSFNDCARMYQAAMQAACQ